MKKLRFCLITSFYPPYHPGGCGLHVYHLANLLARDGHSVVVICSGDAHSYKISGPRPGEYPHHPGISVRRVRSGAGKLEPLFTYLFGRPLFSRGAIRRLLDGNFDLIHYHNISLFGGISALRWGKAAKLFTLHTYWLFCPAHYLWKKGREICRGKECLSCLLYYRRPPQLWRYSGLRDNMLKEVDSLIMPCRFMAEKHREEGLTGRMDHLPYFAGEAKAVSDKSGEEEFGRYRPFFLFVARLESYKGPQVAISAFRKKAGKSNLVMVGTGSRQEYLKDLAGGDPRIHFLNYVVPEKLDWLYQNALAVLAPSVWPEMGNQTVLQAYSHGTPVIAADNGCLPELVAEHDGGIMFKTEDELVEALERMEDPAVRQRFVSRCRTAYQNEYNPGKFLERYYRIIESLL